MTEISINPLLIQFGGPALLAGLLLGALIAWLIARRRIHNMSQSVELLESRIKTQESMQHEREAAFEQASNRLFLFSVGIGRRVFNHNWKRYEYID